MSNQTETKKKKWNWKKTTLVAAGIVATAAVGYTAYKHRDTIGGYMKNLGKSDKKFNNQPKVSQSEPREVRQRPSIEKEKNNRLNQTQPKNKN